MTTPKLQEFFLNEKPAKLMVNLRRQTSDNYATALSKQVDSTYSHTVKTLQKMEKLGLVEFEKKGRKKIVNLTEEGERYADLLHDLVTELESN